MTMRTIAVLLCFLFASCAATFGSGPFMVPIDSTPQGAIVTYCGSDVGRTPCTVKMDSKSAVLSLRTEGFHRREVDVGTSDNGGWVILGILMWGPFELLVDMAADAFSGIDDRPVKVELAPAEAAALERWERWREDYRASKR